MLILHYFDQFCMVLVFLDVLQDFNPLAVAGSQSAFVTLLRCASRRDSPSWANLAPAPLADQSSTFVSTSRMVLGNFAENVRVLHSLIIFGRSTGV